MKLKFSSFEVLSNLQNVSYSFLTEIQQIQILMICVQVKSDMEISFMNRLVYYILACLTYAMHSFVFLFNYFSFG